MTTHPLVPAAILFTSGLALGHALTWPLYLDLLLLATALLAWLLADHLLHAPRSANIALALALLSAGTGVWHADQSQAAPNDIARLAANPGMATLRVRILTPPRTHDTPVTLSAYTARGPSASFIAEVEAIQHNHTWLPLQGNLAVRLPADAAPAQGDRVTLSGMVSRPLPPANPGEFDYARYLAASRVFATLSVRHSALVTIHDPAGRGAPSYLDTFRNHLRARLLDHLVPTDTTAAHTVVALLLGHRDPSIHAVTRSFTDAGVVHLLAVSGSHIALLSVVFWWILRPLPLVRWRAVIVALLVVLYVAATPGGPPVLRAGIGAVLVLLTVLKGRPVIALNALAAALIAVLLYRPADLLDAGCQLTFLTTAGLILITPRLHAFLFGTFLAKRDAIARAIGTRPAHTRAALLRYTCAAVSANIVGALVATPLVAWHFNQINPLAILSGLIALPFVSLLLVLALLQLLLALVWSWAASLTGILLAHLAAFTLTLINALADLPASVLAVRTPPSWLMLLAYATVLLWLTRRRLRLSRATVTLAACVALTATVAWYTLTAHPARMTIHPLDLGNGSAVVVRTPQGHTLLINAGSTSRTHITRRVIEPYLRHQGINSLTALVLTDPTPAHANAAADLLDHYPHTPIYLNASDLANRRTSLAAHYLLRTLESRHHAPKPLAAGDTLTIGGTTPTVLWPPNRPMPLLPNNQRPLILHLTDGTHSALILQGTQDTAATALTPLPQVDQIIFLSEPNSNLQSLLPTPSNP